MGFIVLCELRLTKLFEGGCSVLTVLYFVSGCFVAGLFVRVFENVLECVFARCLGRVQGSGKRCSS